MRGDVLIIEDYHIKAAKGIVQHLIGDIKSTKRRYIITIGGESGSGKSEMGKAIQDELEAAGIKAVILGQDDYFVLPPRSNDAAGIKAVILGQDDYFVLPPRSNDLKRRENSKWLGPHVEVKMKNLEKNIINALKGVKTIKKPLIDYEKNEILEEIVDLEGVGVLIAEGTYTSLLRNVDRRIFIDRNFEDTLAHRRKRERGEEVGDPFIERILETEHKIIAGHKHLADILITKDYGVVFQERLIK